MKLLMSLSRHAGDRRRVTELQDNRPQAFCCFRTRLRNLLPGPGVRLLPMADLEYQCTCNIGEPKSFRTFFNKQFVSGMPMAHREYPLEDLKTSPPG